MTFMCCTLVWLFHIFCRFRFDLFCRCKYSPLKHFFCYTFVNSQRTEQSILNNICVSLGIFFLGNTYLFSNTIIVELCLRHIHWLFWKRNLLLCGGIPLPQTKSSLAFCVILSCQEGWYHAIIQQSLMHNSTGRSGFVLIASVENHLNCVRYFLLYGMVSFMLFWLPFPEASYLPLLLWYMCVKCSFVNSQMFKRLIIVNTHK